MYNIELRRRTFLVLITLLVLSRVFVESQNQFTVNGDKDKAITDKKHILKTLDMTGRTIDYCLEQCLQDCLCVSFQICGMRKLECELCSSNKKKDLSKLKNKKGCMNFMFKGKNLQEYNQQCDAEGCTTLNNCCLTSNPCVNGGTCSPRYFRLNSYRYKCECPDGYTGPRCKESI